MKPVFACVPLKLNTVNIYTDCDISVNALRTEYSDIVAQYAIKAESLLDHKNILQNRLTLSVLC